MDNLQVDCDYVLNPTILAKYGFTMCTEGHRAGKRYFCTTENHEYVLGFSDIGLTIIMIYLDIQKGKNLLSGFKINNDSELEFVLNRLRLLPIKPTNGVNNCVNI